MTDSDRLDYLRRKRKRDLKRILVLEILFCVVGLAGIAILVFLLSLPVFAGERRTYTLYKQDRATGYEIEIDSGMTRSECKRRERARDMNDGYYDYECESE